MKYSISIFVAMIMIGCSAIPLNPEAQRIRITHTEPGKECEFLGDVTGNQGNFFSGPYTSNENLETGARNSLKNKAAALGGDVIFMLTQRAGFTGGGHNSGGSQTNVTLSGSVYKCH